MILLALLAAAAAIQEAPPPPPPAASFANGDFAREGVWELAPPSARGQYRLDYVDGAGRLVPAEAAPEQAFGAARQVVDATPWRGQLVRFRARVRLARPGGFALLAMSVRRPPPKSAGFNDFMGDRPILSQEWQSYEIVGRVAPDAVGISLQVVAQGRAEVLVDDAVLERVEPNPAPPSAAASAYLAEAIGIIRDGHIDSPHADWPRIIGNARAEIGGAITPRDVYPAIRGVIGELGEPHTSFRPAPPPAPPAAAGAPAATLPRPPAAPMPDYRLVDGRFGLVRLPWHIGSAEQSARYSATLREGLTTMDRHACGWIVDLRGNSGGNMWPMLAGLDPLLGAAPFGQFVTAQREVTYWGRTQGEILPAAAIGRGRPAFVLRGAALPVAVLMDDHTVSSGEMTAIAFVGRPNSRSFGGPSGGFTTGNSQLRLSDGAVLVLTGVYIRDRTGHDYDGPMIPDEAVDPARAVAAAERWLTVQPSCARH